jgi:hypothetical protein
MKVHANVQVKNEAALLKHILPIWKEYPIDKWVFFDDNSYDDTSALIKSVFGRKARILKGESSRYTPMENRARMLEHSRENEADFVISLDADELLSANILNDFPKMLEINSVYNVLYYSYEVVGDMSQYRVDSVHNKNFKSFIMPMSHTGRFESEGLTAHTIKTPPIYLPPVMTKDAGIIHLQTLNQKYYTLKHLWYKHRDYVEYLKSIDEINTTYDTIVNGLNFELEDTPKKVIKDITFDASVFEEAAKVKDYKGYISENRVQELLTFGKEHLI